MMRDDFSRVPKTGEGKPGVSVHTSALSRAWRRAAVAFSATALVGSVAIASIVTPSSASAQANPPSAAGAPTPIKPAKLTNSKATLAPGERMLLTWIGVNRPSGSDRAALFPVGAPYDEFITWVFMSTCVQQKALPGIGWATGSCMVSVPERILPGAYQWRMPRTFGMQQIGEIDRWPVFTVTKPVQKNGKPYQPAISTKSDSAIGGSLVSVEWKEVADPTEGDWIGLFLTGESSNRFPQVAERTSCDDETVLAVEAGRCDIGIPFDIVPGSYEFRLMTVIDGFYRVLAVSSPIEIGAPPADATPPAPRMPLRATPTPTPAPAQS